MLTLNNSFSRGGKKGYPQQDVKGEAFALIVFLCPYVEDLKGGNSKASPVGPDDSAAEPGAFPFHSGGISDCSDFSECAGARASDRVVQKVRGNWRERTAGGERVGQAKLEKKSWRRCGSKNSWELKSVLDKQNRRHKSRVLDK